MHRNYSGSRPLRPRVAAALTSTIVILLTGCGGGQATETTVPDGEAMPPWPAPRNVEARVAAAGLDLGPMGVAEHYHPTLRIIIDGENVVVPANIGVDPNTGAMSSLHTHEADGTIHIEADTQGETFTLGQLFTEWGVLLTPRQIGGVKAATDERVSVTSNGETFSGDPIDLQLQPEQSIVLELN